MLSESALAMTGKKSFPSRRTESEEMTVNIPSKEETERTGRMSEYKLVKAQIIQDPTAWEATERVGQRWW